MSSVIMTTKRDKPLQSSPGRVASDGAAARKGKASGAFDLWLQRGLHKLFDDVASEPIPDELLRLIEEDRKGG